jgi:hypothetical protein
MRTSYPILASAGTATGLLLADAKVEDLAAHPAFTEALARHRPQLVKSLTLDELKSHPSFQAEVKTQAEAMVQASLKDLKEETIATLPAVKAYVERKIQEGVVSSESAKSFLAMVKEAKVAEPGRGTALDQPAAPPVTIKGPVHEDSVKLEQETRAILAADKSGTLSYADAQIQAAGRIGYRKPKGDAT